MKLYLCFALLLQELRPFLLYLIHYTYTVTKRTLGKNMNQVLQTIRQRRSVRAFIDQSVSDEILKPILDAGRYAPSGHNTQPWRIVVVKSAEKRKQLAELAPQDDMIKTAPLTLAVLLDRTAGYDELKDAQAIGAMIENMLLAVHSLGLAACWMGKARDSRMEEVIGAREHEDLMALIPVGYAASSPEDVDRLPLEEIARFI
jgi:nitroreductase